MKLVDLRSDQADFPPDRHIVVLLPLGAVEQHGPHLPLGTDTLIVEAIGAAVERRLPETVLLMPAIAVGASDHHLGMPGTASVGTLTIADAVTRQCLSLATSTRIRSFVLLNGHGGNQPACRLALEQLRAARADLRGFAVDYWDAMFDELDPSIPRPAAMGHADHIETSILLGLHPYLVQMSRGADDAFLDGMPPYVATTSGIPERTRGGGVGDPRAATAVDGGAYFSAAVDGLSNLIRNFSGPGEHVSAELPVS